AKVTYATLSADDDSKHARFDAALASARARLGRTYALRIDGRARETAETFASVSPIDTRVEVARAASATAADVEDAVAAAKRAYPAWRAVPWAERAALIDRAADLIRERV